jgi:hypothetical protein
MRITLLIAGAAIAGAAAAAPTTDPLSAWLYNLKFALPDAHGVVDGVDVSLTKATCTHAQIKTLAATGYQTTISINTKDAALDCAFSWAYATSHLSGSGRASASLLVKKATSTISLNASQETRPRPISSSLQNCSAAAKVTALKVKGGLTGALLELLSPWIERKLSGEVGPALCGTLKPLVDANLTRLIRTTTALTNNCAMKARRRNTYDLTAAGAASRSDLLDWRTPRVTALTNIAGRLGACAARQGVNVNLNVSRTFRTPLGDVKVGVTDLDVRGVSDVTLAPARNNSFVVSATGDVAVTSSISLEVTSPLSPTSLTETFAASVSVQKATLDGTLRAALAPTKSQPFGALIRTPLQCLARSLDTVAITDMNIAAEAYKRAELAPQGTPSPLAAGVDATLDALFDLVVRSFPGFIDDAIACSMDAARTDANGDVQRRISTARRAPCAQPPTKGAVDWAASPFLNALDGLSVETANFGLQCLVEGRTTAVGEAAVTFNGVDTLTGLDLSGRGSEIDAALGLDGPASVVVQVDGRNASLHISDLSVAASVTVPLVSTIEDATLDDGSCAFVEALGPPSVETLSIQAQSSLAVNGFDGQTNAALESVGSALAYEIGDVWNDNGRAALNNRWAAQLEDARKRCAGTHKKKKNAAPWALVICVVLVAVVAIVAIGLKVDDALAPTELEAPLLPEQPSIEEDLELLTSPQSLAANAPFYMKVLLPAGLVLTTALFIWSHVAYAATVKLEVRLLPNAGLAGGAEVLHLGDLFKFSLTSSVKDMWQAHVYVLAILVALCSGVWPYTKIILLGVCWFYTPPKRGQILEWIDVLGKWALVDTFVMTLMLVAFHFDVTVGDTTGDIKAASLVDAVTVRVFVEALPSFFVYVLASCLSLVLGHVTVARHRSIDVVDDASEPLCSMRYVLGFAAMLVLVIVGCCLASFDFHIEGLAGLVLGDKAKRRYSLMSLGEAIPGSSKDDRGAISLEIVYFFFGFALPLVQLVLLAVLWLVPLSLKRQQRLYVACEVTTSWAALDVFAVGVVAALLEISKFAQFMVGHRCDALNRFLGKHLDRALNGDDKCFDVSTELTRGAWVLLPAAFVSGVVGVVLLRKAKAKLDERVERARAKDDEASDDSASSSDEEDSLGL